MFGFTEPEQNPSLSNGAPTRVPEPATLLLIAGGLIGIAALRKKFKKK
jgi:hypothetical protein